MLFALKRILVVAIVTAIAFALWPRKTSIKAFDPDQISSLQVEVWQRTAAKDSTGATKALYTLYTTQYHIPPVTAVLMAMDMSKALLLFASAPDQADQEKALQPLKNFYSNFCGALRLHTDPNTLARMELGTWMLQNDRARRAQLTSSISERYAVLYTLSPDDCLPAAKHFAQARKEAEDKNWAAAKTEQLAAWTALKKIIEGKPAE